MNTKLFHFFMARRVTQNRYMMSAHLKVNRKGNNTQGADLDQKEHALNK